MTTMKIEFRTRVGDAMRARVADGLKTALASLVVEPTIARATVTDENGPKGGPAIRCALEVKQPRRPAVHVEAVAATEQLAFERALAKLARAGGRPRREAPPQKVLCRRAVAGGLVRRRTSQWPSGF